MELTADATLALVAERLNRLHGTWTLAEPGVLRGPGRFAVTLGAAHGGGRNHLDLNIIIDTDRAAETTIPDCATGLAADPTEAARQAIGVWCDTTARPVLELLTHRGELAEHYSATDPEGFPGWHMIAGNLAGWGGGGDPGALQRWLMNNPPWKTLAPVIAAGLDRDQLNGIKFFIAARAGYEVAEVRINGRAHEPSTAALLAQNWPRPTELTAARTFILLIHRDDQSG